MPVCTWCGIDSKNDVICDWCKRPLALKNARMHDNRSAVDLLKDDEPADNNLLAKALAFTGVAAVVALVIVAVVMVSRKSDVAQDGVPPEFSKNSNLVAERTPAVPPTPPAAQPQGSGQPVFLAAQSLPSSNGTSSQVLLVDPNVRKDKDRTVTIHLTDDANVGVIPNPIRLAGGILRAVGSKRAIVGRVSIINSSEFSVTEFRLEANIGGATYTLSPFEGSVDHPKAYNQLTISAGEKLTIPVIVRGRNASKRGSIVPATISVEAFMDGGSQSVIRDQIVTP